MFAAYKYAPKYIHVYVYLETYKLSAHMSVRVESNIC